MRLLWALVGVFLAELLVLGVWGACAQTYTVQELGEFQPSDVNELGWVIGRSAGKPALWRDGAILPMQDLGSGGWPRHFSAADSRVSVGSVRLSTGVEAAAMWDASGALTLLATHDASYGSVAYGQDKRGRIGGVHGRLDHGYGKPVSSAARWLSPQSLTVLDTVEDSWSEAVGIDARGFVWGLDGSVKGSQPSHGVVAWDLRGEKRVVPNNPGRWASPVAVNPKGVVVGIVTRLTSYDIDPFQATLERGYQLLPNYPGAQCSPVDIDGKDVILGTCWGPDVGDVPVVWEKRGIRPLPITPPIPGRPFQLSGMNDRGQLVGWTSELVPGPYGYPVTRIKGLLYTPVAQVAGR